MTAHNPLVLDGPDLTDDRIRLFAADRDENGHVQVSRIQVSEELAKQANSFPGCGSTASWGPAGTDMKQILTLFPGKKHTDLINAL